MHLSMGLALTLLFALQDPADRSEASDAYQDGLTAYETRDFAGAIEAFTRAFELAAEIEDETERATAMNRLRFNLARAHLGAFDIDADAKHLRTAESLLVDYREDERRQGRDPDSDLDLVQLERELSAALETVRPTADAEGPLPARAAIVNPTQPPRRRGRIIAGGSLLGLSAASLGVMGFGLARGNALEQEYLDDPTASGRNDLASQGDRWNLIAGVTGGVGAALAVSGAVLLATGIRPRRRATIDATASRTSFIIGARGTF